MNNISAVPTFKTLVAGTSALLVAANPRRAYLFIQNTGLGGPFTYQFGRAPAAVGDGPSLDPALTAGGQGGSFEYVDTVPQNAIYGLSAAGTTVSITEG